LEDGLGFGSGRGEIDGQGGSRAGEEVWREEGDDWWARVVSVGRERGRVPWGLSGVGPWAQLVAGPNWSPAAFSSFLYFFSISFLISDLFNIFCKSIILLKQLTINGED
jgi:hypothetical protein